MQSLCEKAKAPETSGMSMPSARPLMDALQHHLYEATEHEQQLSKLKATYRAHVAGLEATLQLLGCGDLDKPLQQPCQDEPIVTPVSSDIAPKGEDSEFGALRSELRIEWTRTLPNETSNIRDQKPSAPSKTIKFRLEAISDNRHKNCLADALQGFVLGPSSHIRLLWDIMGMMMILYTTMALPLTVFGFEHTKVARVMLYVSTVFWTIDVPVNFFMGYHDNGVAILDLEKVAHRYMRTWFLADVFMACMDWVDLLSSWFLPSIVSVARLAKISRVLHIIHVIRLMRITKLCDAFEKITLVYSKNVIVVMSICKKITCIVIANHFIACGWYFVCQNAGDYSDSYRSIERSKATLFFRYVIGFHWSLCQFTPAPNNYHPSTFEERVYAICVLIFGIALFSSLLGSITADFTFLRKMQSEAMKQQLRIRQYFSTNAVPLQLGHRIISYVQQHSARMKRPVVEDDIHSFKCLTSTLVAQLRAQVYAPVISEHPLFYSIGVAFDNLMLETCVFAMRERVFTISEELFKHGEEAKCMVFIAGYSLEYHDVMHEGQVHRLSAGAWLCEACLWLHFEHTGNLVADRCGELRELDVPIFLSLVSQHRECVGPLKKYALLYAKWVSEICGLHALSDISGDFDTASGIAQEAFEGIVMPEVSAPVTLRKEPHRLNESLSKGQPFVVAVTEK